MIMQGNTPRSLTWPGCLAVVALALTVLPMLPSLHGQPPREEEAREQLEEAEKALEKAKAALEHQKAELARKAKELAKAQQQVANESARKAEAMLLLQDKDLLVLKAKGGYRIEITLPADDSMNPKEIVAKIRKVLPEDLRNKVVVRPVPETQQLRIHMDPPSVRVDPFSPPRQPTLPGLPGSPRPGVIPGNPNGNPNVPLSKSSEKRINDLEKKLEKVLRELQELRKQMKQPRGGPARPGAVPAAGAYAPPENQILYPVPAPGTAAPAVPADLLPGTWVPPAPPAAPAPPAPPSDPSARRLPNPYGEHRSVC